jgi:hypothetical protein
MHVCPEHQSVMFGGGVRVNGLNSAAHVHCEVRVSIVAIIAMMAATARCVASRHRQVSLNDTSKCLQSKMSKS